MPKVIEKSFDVGFDQEVVLAPEQLIRQRANRIMWPPLWPVAMARRKVGQMYPAALAELVSCAGCVGVLAPSPDSGPLPCLGLLWANPIPGSPGSASCRCTSLPAWLSQLVRRVLSGLPRFRSAPSSRATLSDPGRLAKASPKAALSLLGSDNTRSSPPAVARFEAELLKLGATPACGP